MIDLQAAIEYVWCNGRLLERAALAQTLGLEVPGRVADVLRAYRTSDGGFGYALEPDLCAPEPQPLYVEFAFQTLYHCDLRSPDLAAGACEFMSQHADAERGIVTLFPSALAHPHAAHWESPAAFEPSMDRLVSIVGLLAWQRVAHRWLGHATDFCLERLSRIEIEDAHTLRNAFVLLESVRYLVDVSALRARLVDQLSRAQFLIRDAPVRGYGLTPLNFCPSPEAYCRDLFTDGQYAGHLDDLASRQQPDGGWPITWSPPGDKAVWSWRAYATVRAIAVLRAWGRV
ncbi:MAG: hypothetical protein R6X16_15045 [Anaerolineae bacterium]